MNCILYKGNRKRRRLNYDRTFSRPALNKGADTSATLSKSVIEKLLRKQLNYDGLVISDALNMHSVSKLYERKGQLEWKPLMPEMTCCALLKTYQKVFKKYLKRNSETHRSQLQPLDEMQEKVGLLDKEEAPNSELDFVAASIKP
jgi:beta-glucosidase-like glycosyl hydrolase